jgi:XTP/dITP diphosphohydrolase
MYKENTILIATSNQGKLKEISNFFSESDINFISLKEVLADIIEPVENGLTFFDNSLIKAKYYSELTNLPVIADDSGIEIEALDWGPSVYSYRFADELGGYEGAFKKIEETLLKKKLPYSKARFVCVIVLYNSATNTKSFHGQVDGRVEFPLKGVDGFGYDPIFIPDGEDRSFAEMTKEEKNKISHRGRALLKLKKFLYDQF